MNKLKNTLLFLFPLFAFAEEQITYITPGTYKITTEKNLEIQRFELGLKCKIYSKLRLIGAPISTRINQTKNKVILNHKINSLTLTNLYLNTPLTLTFPMSEFTSYVHACSFIADIIVMKDGKQFKRNDLSLSDYTIHSKNHDASYDFKNTLNYRTLEINKYTNEIFLLIFLFCNLIKDWCTFNLHKMYIT